MSKRERDRRHDAKRRYDRPWRKWYDGPRWRKIREAQLTAHPLCAWHLARNCPVKAEVVHHVEPHLGDEYKFYNGKVESLCKACHDSPAQQVERRGYSDVIGADGFPIDPHHPMNRGYTPNPNRPQG